MKWHIYGAVLFAMLLSVVNCQYTYDCRRLEDCKNAGTCTKDECTCLGTFSGYACEYDTTSTACADNICVNGGTCYNDGTADVCSCPFGFYGATCELELVQITCDGNKAVFLMSLSDEFVGTVKLGDLNGTTTVAECVMTEAAINKMKTYSLAVDLTDDDSNTDAACKIANIDKVTDTAGEISYTALFLVNYVTDVTTSLDELYKLTCTHDTTGMELYKEITNIGVVNENLTVVDFNETYRPVDLTVLDEFGTGLTKDLFVGDTFMLFVFLTDELAYSSVFIENCTTNNTLPNEESKLFTILENGCPTKQSKKVVSEQTDASHELTLSEGEQPVTMNGKKLLIQAFKFHDSNKIGILCTAKICKPGDATCAAPINCDDIMNQAAGGGGDTTGGKRKRRAADDDEETVEETVSTVITVLGANSFKSSTSTGTKTFDSVKTCLARTEITAVVSVLGGVVFILLIVCFCLACVILGRRKKAHKFDFDRLSQPKQDRFHIPRAHVNESFREL